MVNKMMKPTKVLQLATAQARRHNLTIEEVRYRGKGSHRYFLVHDQNGNEVGRFTVTGHKKEVKIGTLRNIEESLEHLFGKKWMEEK
jgi:predicted RNA binding protein YcfA (HicA-like mRNA interferase family)